jgi:hypothetical protein
VVEAWVDKLEDVPTETIIDIHEPRPCVDPLAHVPLPPGFSSPDVPIPGAGSPTTRCNADLWRSVPPRILSTTILVHLDSSMFIRPAPSSRGHWSRDDDDYYDGDDDSTRTDEEAYPWTFGVPDDVWHQRIEAASSGAAAGQHRPRPRNGRGRRRNLTPAGFDAVPLPDPARVSGPEGPINVTSLPQPDKGTEKGAASPTIADGGHQDGTVLTRPAPTAARPDQPTTRVLQVNEGTGATAVPPKQATLLPEDEVEDALQQLQLQDNSVLGLDCSPLPMLATPPAPQRVTERQDETTPTARDVLATPVSIGPGPAPGMVTPLAAHHSAAHHTTPLDGLLERVCSPLEPALLPPPAAAPPRLTRRRRPPASATRRSHRNLNKKKQLTGSGNSTMRLARKLIISKKGLAIAEPGEEEEEEAVDAYSTAFDEPIDDEKIEALSALAKSGHAKKNRHRSRAVGRSP